MKIENAEAPTLVQGKYTCNKCNKLFTANSSLKRHMQIHNGQFRYYCEIYRRGFTNSYNLKEHMRNHQGLRLQCKYCGKTFAKKQTSDYHQSVHTGQYRLTCNTCGKGFNIKQNYDNHIQSHINSTV